MCLGVPAQIISLSNDNVAVVDVNSNRVKISTVLTPQAKTGDWVLVHAGFAMEIIDGKSAQESMELMLELKRLREAL